MHKKPAHFLAPGQYQALGTLKVTVHPNITSVFSSYLAENSLSPLQRLRLNAPWGITVLCWESEVHNNHVPKM
jgi:hypothetical protein